MPSIIIIFHSLISSWPSGQRTRLNIQEGTAHLSLNTRHFTILLSWSFTKNTDVTSRRPCQLEYLCYIMIFNSFQFHVIILNCLYHVSHWSLLHDSLIWTLTHNKVISIMTHPQQLSAVISVSKSSHNHIQTIIVFLNAISKRCRKNQSKRNLIKNNLTFVYFK